MIVFRYKLTYLILVAFLLIGGGGAVWFSALFLRIITTNFDFTGFSGWLIFLLIGSGGMFTSIGTAMKLYIKAQSQSVVIGDNGLFTLSVSIDDLTGFKMFTHRTKFKAYRAFVIETASGAQVAFTEMQLNDFDAARDYVKALLPRNVMIKRKLWKSGGVKTVWIICALITVIYITVFVCF